MSEIKYNTPNFFKKDCDLTNDYKVFWRFIYIFESEKLSVF